MKWTIMWHDISMCKPFNHVTWNIWNSFCWKSWNMKTDIQYFDILYWKSAIIWIIVTIKSCKPSISCFCPPSRWQATRWCSRLRRSYGDRKIGRIHGSSNGVICIHIYIYTYIHALIMNISSGIWSCIKTHPEISISQSYIHIWVNYNDLTVLPHWNHG